ncbi:hypothetical protein I4U23_005467 [Adineta vaga]|nr:hypothetical protein I4U23_005467 [Adineta vaga]
MLLLSSGTIPITGRSQSITSFAQQRIWFDEKLYRDAATSSVTNNLLLPLVIKDGSMSIERIRSAVVTVLERHMVLRTAIHFDNDCGKLIQQVQPIVDNYSYSFELTKKNLHAQNEIDDLLKNERISHFAKLEQGLVVRCQLVKIRFDDDMESLHPDDLIIFIFHHIAFDYNSAGSFITAFTRAYDQTECNIAKLQYIDFTQYEDQQLINGTENSEIGRAQQFWSRMIDDYNLNEKYPLPITSMLRNKIRSGRAYSTSFVLDSNLVEAQIKFAVSHNQITICSFPTDEMTLKSRTKDATLSLYTDRPWLHVTGVAFNDFTLKMIHNQSSRTTSCIFECTADCYDEMATSSIGQHFQNLLLYIFAKKTETNGFDPTREKIGNLSPLQIVVPNLSEVSQHLPNVTETNRKGKAEDDHDC